MRRTRRPASTGEGDNRWRIDLGRTDIHRDDRVLVVDVLNPTPATTPQPATNKFIDWSSTERRCYDYRLFSSSSDEEADKKQKARRLIEQLQEDFTDEEIQQILKETKKKQSKAVQKRFKRGGSK
jgi:hypothetical protein